MDASGDWRWGVDTAGHRGMFPAAFVQENAENDDAAGQKDIFPSSVTLENTGIEDEDAEC